MLVSHAPASRMDASPRTRGTPEHRRPTGEDNPAHERYAREFEGVETIGEAIRLRDRLRKEVVSATRRVLVPSTTETADELAARIVEDGAGWSLADVASAMRCTRTFARRARLLAGRDPENGHVPRDADPLAVATELHAMGRSYRTISALTGIPRSTLHRRFAA